jgi:hypothetical protein
MEKQGNKESENRETKGHNYESDMDFADPFEEEFSAPSDPFSPPDLEIKGKKE